MKRYITTLFALLIMLAFGSCGKDKPDSRVEIESISLDPNSAALQVGEQVRFTVRFAPENATNNSVKWTSSDSKIAKVENGLVTALAEGEADITVASISGQKTATAHIMVSPKIIKVQSVSLDTQEKTLTEGDSFTLKATVLPETASNKELSWSSSDTDIARVENGKVTALKVGTAIITVKTVDGEKTATCQVTVTKKKVEVETINLSAVELNLTEGEKETLTAKVLPENATDKTITWSSSDEAVATVSPEGVVTALKEGEAVITAAASNGVKATCKLVVKKKIVEVVSIKLSKTELSLDEGQTYTLQATVLPKNASDPTVTWSSSDEAVATVSPEGVVTAHKVGQAVITATAVNGVKASCELTVNRKIESITLSQTKLTLNVNQSQTLIATIQPEDLSTEPLTWSSSDDAVATVKAGLVTAKKEGKATITVMAANGVKANCEVIVKQKSADDIPVVDL